MATVPPPKRRLPRPATDKKLTPLGERLEAAWTHARTSQNSIESRLGIRGYLSRVKYGERGGTSISPDLLEAIADICGVDYHWLATGRGSMLPPRTPYVHGPEPKTPAPPSATRNK
jgi:transcriptional regulator with XRE-family HTH domain